MKKLPAIQFYPGDWRRNPKVQSLTYEERGLWFEMLCLMHFAEPRGKLPLEDLPMLLGIDQAKAKQTVAKLLAKEVANTEQNYIICRRMIKESKISELRANAGFRGGSKAQAKAQAKRKANNVTPSPSPITTTLTDTKETKDSCSEQQKLSEPSLDPSLLEILKDCPHLSLVSTGASSNFWDSVIASCEPLLGKGTPSWLNMKIRAWNQWFESNKSRRSKDRKFLENRLTKWLTKDLEELARKK